MLLTVEDQPASVLELLWIREAHELHPRGDDLPPPLSDTPPVVRNDMVDAATRVRWEDAWPAIWSAVAAHAGTENDPRLFEQLQQTAGGSIERADLLHRMVGPSWRDDFGDAAFDGDAYGEWSQRGMDAHLEAMPRRLEDTPERRDLPALVPAWRAGLTKIVEVPCAGEFTRRIGPHALLLTVETRRDSDRYRRALSTFVEVAPAG
jgi:hypothetical protein